MRTVKVRNLLLGQGRPKICIPLAGRTLGEIEDQMDALKGYPADLVEWRCDWYEDVEDLGKLDQVLGRISRTLPELPLLVTFRTAGEGGERGVGKKEYFALLDYLAGRPEPDLLDMEAWFAPEETAAHVANLQKKGKKVILSYHNFSETPGLEEMVERLETMAHMGADLAKIAVMPVTMEDTYRLLRATSLVYEKDLCPLITMAMGRTGLLSRLCGDFSGSCLTFGSAGVSSAPGQAAADRLKLVLDEIHAMV